MHGLRRSVCTAMCSCADMFLLCGFYRLRGPLGEEGLEVGEQALKQVDLRDGDGGRHGGLVGEEGREA